ncbi:MAG TPA: DMT family transporter [Gemmataceae bacterium]|nr:DMT family transporter [Gemmataceae bacterium]
MKARLTNLMHCMAPLLAALFWGGAYIWIKMGLEGFSPLTLVTLRFTLTALGFLALFAVRAISFRRIRLADAPRFALLVASGVLVYHLSLVAAETVLPASAASLIGQMVAVFTIGLSAVKRPSVLKARTVVGVALALAGALLVIWGGRSPSGGALSAWAVAVCFAAPLSMACYMLLGKPMVERYGAANLTAQVCIAGGAILTAVTAFRPGVMQELSSASVTAWVAAGCLALFCTVAAYTLWFHALSTRSASQLSIYSYLVPVFSVAAAAVVLGEPITLPLALGGAVVIAGVYVTNRKPRTAGPVQTAPASGRLPRNRPANAPCRSRPPHRRTTAGGTLQHR